MFYQSKFNFHGWYGRLENQICNYFVLKSQKFNKLDFSLDSDISIFNWLLISEQKLSANRVITEYIYVCPSMGLLGIYSAASRRGQNTQYLSTQAYKFMSEYEVWAPDRLNYYVHFIHFLCCLSLGDMGPMTTQPSTTQHSPVQTQEVLLIKVNSYRQWIIMILQNCFYETNLSHQFLAR